MDLYDARALYVADLKRRGRSLNTLTAAERTLAAFEQTMDNTRTRFTAFDPWLVDEIDREDIERFLHASDGESTLKPASFNRYRSVLHSFFDWCVQRSYCNSNPVDSLPAMPAAAPEPPLILSPAEMLKMLDDANPVERIALALGMNTGLRASDIANLRVGDVDLATGYISTGIQKTKGVDRKPITDELNNELRRWFVAYAQSLDLFPQELQNDWYLVPSYTLAVPPQREFPIPKLVTYPERPMTHLHRLVQRALQRQGLPTDGQGFHTLRRSSARALFELLRESESADHALMVVKEFLNHKSVTQTERYLGVNHERTIRDDLLRGQSFLGRPKSEAGLTAAAVADINLRHGFRYGNDARIY